MRSYSGSELSRKQVFSIAALFFCLAVSAMSSHTEQVQTQSTLAQLPQACHLSSAHSARPPLTQSSLAPAACYQTQAQPGSSRAVLCCP